FGDPAALAGNRLDDFGARLLWRRVIENETTGLLDTFEAARLAADARHLMHEWAVDVPTEVIHEEYDHFMSWHTAYEEELAACDADDAELRLQRLLLCLEGDGGGLRLPEHIVLAGRREFRRRQQRWLTALEGPDCCIHLLAHSGSPAREISRHAAAERGAEWRAAVAWGRRKLDSGTGRYAIVAMSL